MNTHDSRHNRLAGTVRSLREDIMRQLQPAGGDTALDAFNAYPLSRSSMHAVAAVEMGRNGSAVRFFAKGDVDYHGPQRLETEEYVLRCIAPEIWQANAKTRCPRVLAFFPEQELLLLEMVDGKSLKDVLFGLGPSPGNLSDLLALSGEWLARFHAITQSAPANPFEWLESAFAGKKIRDVFHNCGVAELYPALANLLQQFRVKYPHFCRPLCRVHSEFIPLHVLVKNDAIYVIDFGASRLGFGYEDVAMFSTFFDALLPWRAVAGSLHLRLAKQKNIFRKSYLAHCQQTFGVPDHIVMRFAYLLAMAHHESCWEKTPASPAAALHAFVGRAWVRRRFAARARREFACLQQMVSAPPVWQLDYTSPAAK